MATTTTYHALTKPEDTDFADNDPLNTNFDAIDKAMSDLGDIKMTARSTAPGANWMICDGSAISRTTYADLFTAISTNYGVGDGSTTFNIPDMRGRFPLGVSGTYTMGTSGGSATHTLTEAELPAHVHTIAHDHNIQHDHDINMSTALGGSNANAGRGTATTAITAAAPINGANTTQSGASSAADSGSVGSGSAHENMPPWKTVNYLIRVL